jgi:hypothetical protein
MVAEKSARSAHFQFDALWSKVAITACAGDTTASGMRYREDVKAAEITSNLVVGLLAASRRMLNSGSWTKVSLGKH